MPAKPEEKLIREELAKTRNEISILEQTCKDAASIISNQELKIDRLRIELGAAKEEISRLEVVERRSQIEGRLIYLKSNALYRAVEMGKVTTLLFEFLADVKTSDFDDELERL